MAEGRVPGFEMTSESISSKLDTLSEQIVLLDPEDLEALETIQGLLASTLTWAEASAAEGIKVLAVEACSLVAKVIKRDVSDPDAAIDQVSQAVSSIQAEFVRFEQEGSQPPEGLVKDEAPRPATSGPAPYKLPPYVDDAIFQEFITRQVGVLEEIESSILELENSGSESAAAEIKRTIHTIKGESGLLAMGDVERLCHIVEDAMAERASADLIDPLLAAKDWFGVAFAAYSNGHIPDDGIEKVIAALQEGDTAESTSSQNPAHDGEIASLVAELGELITGASTTDLQSLAEIHTYLESLSLELNGANLAPAVEAADAMADTVSQIILEEFENPESALDAVECGIAAFSEALADGSSLDGLVFVFDPSQGESGSDVADMDASIGTFLSDAHEYLDACSLHIVALASDADDLDALGSLQRTFAGITETAEHLALDLIAQISAAMLDIVRLAAERHIRVSEAFVDVVSEATEFISTRVEELKSALDTGETVGEAPNPTSLLTKIAQVARDTEVSDDVPEDDKRGQAPPDRIGEILVEQGAASHRSVEEALVQQMRPWASLKLGQLVAEAGIATRSQINEALKIHNSDASRGHVGEVLIQLGVVTEAQLRELLDKQAAKQEPPKIGEILVRTGDASAKDVVDALRAQKKSAGRVQKSILHESVKVDSARLSGLVDMIGELVIAETMVSLSEEMKDGMSPELTRNLSQLDKITRELQEMGTTLRMVPVRQTFQKMARLVRDLAKKSGREVEFCTSGEETELDKALVDRIGDPLVHLVRNAVDHGLEKSIEERRKAGKGPKGRIELRAFHRGGSIYVEVEDDGRGLNREAILAKARSLDIIQNGDTLDDKEVWNLIFRPGFTTVDTVTEVSGRGVGMDVVRRGIDELRGSVDITSKPGQGTVFSIRLPLTLAIIDGMVIRCGEERYILPTLSVMRLIRPDVEDLTSVFVKEKLLNVEGRLVPLHFLSDLFDIPCDSHDVQQGVIVVIEYEDRVIALAVDEVLGQQQTVIKSLGNAIGNVSGISGGAILPDGRIGLILDVSSLTKMVKDSGAKPPRREKEASVAKK